MNFITRISILMHGINLQLGYNSFDNEVLNAAILKHADQLRALEAKSDRLKHLAVLLTEETGALITHSSNGFAAHFKSEADLIAWKLRWL